VLAAGSLAVLHVAGVETSDLGRDPAVVGGLGADVGMLSQLGLMLWGLAVGACLLAAAAGYLRGDPQLAVFLASTAALLLVLGVDDALLIHEQVIPNKVGIAEEIVFLALGSLVLAYAARFRRELLGGDVILLGVGAAMLALTVAVDVLDALPLTVEDYFKLIGMVALAIWCFSTSLQALVEAPGQGLERGVEVGAGDSADAG
jgi:hypothetical protein